MEANTKQIYLQTIHTIIEREKTRADILNEKTLEGLTDDEHTRLIALVMRLPREFTDSDDVIYQLLTTLRQYNFLIQKIMGAVAIDPIDINTAKSATQAALSISVKDYL